MGCAKMHEQLQIERNFKRETTTKKKHVKLCDRPQQQQQHHHDADGMDDIK